MGDPRRVIRPLFPPVRFACHASEGGGQLAGSALDAQVLQPGSDQGHTPTRLIIHRCVSPTSSLNRRVKVVRDMAACSAGVRSVHFAPGVSCRALITARVRLSASAESQPTAVLRPQAAAASLHEHEGGQLLRDNATARLRFA